MSSTPVFQSLSPDCVSSSDLGGIDTCSTKAPVVVAPNISEPPRKHTRWSCLGVNRQPLGTLCRLVNFVQHEKWEGAHLVLLVTLGYEFSGVDHLSCKALLDEVLVYRCHRVIVHLRGRGMQSIADRIARITTSSHLDKHPQFGSRQYIPYENWSESIYQDSQSGGTV